MNDRVRFRVLDEPVGPARLAFSYLAALIALLFGGFFLLIWTQFDGVVCREDALCSLGWLLAGAATGVVLGGAVAAYGLRLGWEWTAVVAAAVLGAPLWAQNLQVSTLAALLLLLPAVAGLATWTGPMRPRWRPWVIGGVAAALLVGSIIMIAMPPGG